ncbi:MAG: response regulator [Ilumatobacter sp.]
MVDILTHLSRGSGVLVSLLVLIAENDRAVRESLSPALTLEGYEVTTVTNGAQAPESIREHPADLLPLAVSMPVLDGPTPRAAAFAKPPVWWRRDLRRRRQGGDRPVRQGAVRRSVVDRVDR